MPTKPSTASTWLTALLLAAGAAPAWAGGELAVGTSVTEDHEHAAVVSASWLPHLRPLGGALLLGEVGALYVAGRGHVDGQDLGDGVAVGFAGLRYERAGGGLTLGAAIGGQSGHTDALSGGPQFVTTLGWRWTRAGILLRHVSNAGRREPNGGETMLLGAWRF
jgi:hypothetical protein